MIVKLARKKKYKQKGDNLSLHFTYGMYFNAYCH